MNAVLFEKTAKGRDEIATRSHHLPSRLRSLLVLVDGKTPADDLLKKIAGLGLRWEHLAELDSEGFIHVIQLSAEPTQVPAPSKLEDRPDDMGHALDPPPGISAPGNGAADAQLPMSDVERLQAIPKFYNATIRDLIGLKGFGLQLKVERASTLEDYQALRRPYLDAVLKAKGPDFTRDLRERLDWLLYGSNGTTPPHG